MSVEKPLEIRWKAVETPLPACGFQWKTASVSPDIGGKPGSYAVDFRGKPRDSGWFFQPAPRFQGTSAPLFCRQQGINARPRPETPLLFSRSSGSLSTIFARASCGFQVTVLGRPAAFFFFSFLPAAEIPVLSRLFGFRLPPVGCM